MTKQAITIRCQYSEAGDMREILLQSFLLFLGKELRQTGVKICGGTSAGVSQT